MPMSLTSTSGRNVSKATSASSTHSWFVCYGPAKNPTIAMCVFAEAAGHGGSVAGPIARKVLDHYFGLKEGKIPRTEVAD